ncbi:MAG TPA: DNA-binding protein [Candidatus Paceibacterota bacterium]|nr:DNA-binding protein [Candidatus Paceibacterota bacterium]
MKVFLDATILYSASRPERLMARFVDLLLQRTECVSNNYALCEAERNLARNEPACLIHLEAIRQRLQIVTALQNISGVDLREKDRPILAGAVAGACSHLLTSDRRDFGCFFGKKIQGVKVVSPQMMAEEMGLKRK